MKIDMCRLTRLKMFFMLTDNFAANLFWVNICRFQLQKHGYRNRISQSKWLVIWIKITSSSIHLLELRALKIVNTNLPFHYDQLMKRHKQSETGKNWLDVLEARRDAVFLSVESCWRYFSHHCTFGSWWWDFRFKL